MDTGIRTDAWTVAGETLAPGAAKGRLAFLHSDFSLLGSEQPRAGGIEQELERFEEHIDGLAAELVEVVAALEAESADTQAQIMKTHLYLIKDRKFHQDVCREIRNSGLSAEMAIESVLRRIMAVFESSKNSLMVERAGDIRDIIGRLIRRVSRQHRQAFESLRASPPVVLAIKELLPSVVLEARNSSVVGFVVERGSSLSHAAILAKSLGFPVLRIDDLESLEAARDQEVLVDATDGRLLVAPAYEAVYEHLGHRLATRTVDRASLPVRLWINVADPAQVSPLLLEQVAGIGLYRTEVLFMEQTDDFPSEEQQYEVYRSLFEICPDCALTIRTVDIGGDKMLPYFPLGRQENPFLGVRANRVYREHPEIFITQMRAILRAAVNSADLRIMYPMISGPEDLKFIARLLGEAVRSLRARHVAYQDRFLEGIMIEVPSAAWNCAELLEMVDFASVGTNDLLQYFFAVGRDDMNVSQSYRTQDPVALRMLKRLADAAAYAGKPLSICGEIASDPQLLPLLLGLGFKDLSVDIRLLPQVQEQASGLSLAECEELARECLKVKTAQDVRALLIESGLVKKHVAARQKSWGQAIDPVCEAVVDTADAGLTITRKGRKIHFCSPECRDKYFAAERHEQPNVRQAC